MSHDFSLDHLSPDEIFPDPVIHHFSTTTRQLKLCKSRSKLLNSSDAGILEEDLWQTISNSGARVLSYDVFDTFLLRNNKPEASRYLELSGLILDRLQKSDPKNKYLKDLTAADLCEARALGMKMTYRTRPLVQGCGEGLIDDVVTIQIKMLGLEQEAQKIFLQAEIDYEADNLELNPVLVNLAKRFKSAGGTFILVSDMYLPAKTIEKIISKLMTKPLHDHLFSSADMVISKRSGKIFAAIEKQYAKAPSDFIHLGDAWTGDVERPRDAGWSAIYLPVSDCERQIRKRNLADFITEMDASGIETRPWAKV